MNCAALALDAPLNVKVTPRIDGHVSIRYFGEHGERVPRDRSNLVVRAMEAALHLKGLEFTGADFEIYSSVPVAVGLGSSTAAVWAGLIAADRLFRLHLDEKSFFELAAIYESRGENLRAAWYGGFVVCAEEGSELGYQRTVVPENLALSVVIPETSMVLGDQDVKPDKPCRQDAEAHLRRALSFAEFFGQPGSGRTPAPDSSAPALGDKVLPGTEEALRVQTPGLLAVFVCGRGPAVTVLAQGDSAEAVRAVRDCFVQHGAVTRTTEFRPSNAGAREWNAVQPGVTLPLSKGLSALLPKSARVPV